MSAGIRGILDPTEGAGISRRRNTLRGKTPRNNATASITATVNVRSMDRRVNESCPTRNNAVERIPKPPSKTNVMRSNRRYSEGMNSESKAPAPNAAIVMMLRPKIAFRASQAMP